MHQKNNQNYLLIFIVLVLALVAVLFFQGNSKLEEDYRIGLENEEKIKSVLDEVPVLAKAVSIHNMDTGRKIYGKNDEVMMPIASLVKIMTVIVGLSSKDKEGTISISQNAISQTGDYGLFSQENWKTQDVAKFTLVSSANDGAYAFAESDMNGFLKEMNDKARRLGMERTIFSNVTGLDMSLDMAGALASATDVNTMAIYGWRSYPEVFYSTTNSEINLSSTYGVNHSFKNTNPIVSNIPNLMFSKTGYTEIAGGNLTVIFLNKKGEKIIVTVLGSTFDGRFSDMEKLVNVLYDL
jgi:D-alanyl-D-alanine carboxypeptidase